MIVIRDYVMVALLITFLIGAFFVSWLADFLSSLTDVSLAFDWLSVYFGLVVGAVVFMSSIKKEHIREITD